MRRDKRNKDWIWKKFRDWSGNGDDGGFYGRYRRENRENDKGIIEIRREDGLDWRYSKFRSRKRDGDLWFNDGKGEIFRMDRRDNLRNWMMNENWKIKSYDGR